MRNINNLTSPSMDKAWAVNNSRVHEPHCMQLTGRVVNILDTKHEKAGLQSVVSTNCSCLSPQDQIKLLEILTEFEEILTEFEELFDGTLDDWKTDPISFELEEGTKPYHGRLYPVPKTYRETTIRELNRLVKLRVVEHQPGSEWASPSFIIPKKTEYTW